MTGQPNSTSCFHKVSMVGASYIHACVYKTKLYWNLGLWTCKGACYHSWEPKIGPWDPKDPKSKWQRTDFSNCHMISTLKTMACTWLHTQNSLLQNENMFKQNKQSHTLLKKPYKVWPTSSLGDVSFPNKLFCLKNRQTFAYNTYVFKGQDTFFKKINFFFFSLYI